MTEEAMSEQDELLLTPEEQAVVNVEAIKRSSRGQVADLRTMMLEAQLAKAKQHYEQKIKDELWVITGRAKSYEQYRYLVNELMRALGGK